MLGMWLTGNADLTWGDHQKLAGGEIVRVIGESAVEVIDLGLKISARQPEEQNTGVFKALVVNQLAKIPVGNHKNALFRPGNCQDILISKAMRVVAGDRRYVVS